MKLEIIENTQTKKYRKFEKYSNFTFNEKSFQLITVALQLNVTWFSFLLHLRAV